MRAFLCISVFTWTHSSTLIRRKRKQFCSEPARSGRRSTRQLESTSLVRTLRSVRPSSCWVSHSTKIWRSIATSPKSSAVVSVQRKFTKRLPGYASQSYKDMLSRLGLDSLEWRCLRYDLLLTYKIVFGLTDVVASDMFTFTSCLHYINTRGHAYKLYPHNSRIDVRKFFFSERVIAPWNNSPATSEHIFFARLLHF